MSRRVTPSLLLVVLLAGLLCVVSAPAVGQTVSEANGTEDSVGASSVAVVELTPSTDQTITAGEGIDFNATAYDAFGTVIEDNDKNFSWSYDNDYSINWTGYFESTTAGTYWVTATYNGTTSATTSVTVEPASANYVWLDPEEPTVITGNSTDFDAYATDTYGNVNDTTDSNFTWSAASGTIDGSGYYTAPSSTGVDSISAELDGAEESTSVYVHPTGVDRVEISPATDQTITAGTDINFTTTAYNASDGEIDVSDRLFTWSINTDYVNPINASGYFSDRDAGTYEINATLSGVTSNSTHITVEPASLATVDVFSYDYFIRAGESSDFNAVAQDSYGNTIEGDDSAFDWAATDGSIDGTGFYTAPTSTGIVEIAAEYGGEFGQISLEVLPGPVGEVTLGPATPTVGTNGTLAFNATAHDVYGNLITTRNRSFGWSASNGSINTSGSYTAPKTGGMPNVTVNYAGAAYTETQVTVLESGALTLSSLDIGGHGHEAFLPPGTNGTVSGNLTNAVTASRTVNLSLMIESVGSQRLVTVNQTVDIGPENSTTIQFTNVTGDLETGVYNVSVSATTDTARVRKRGNLMISVDVTGDGNPARDTSGDQLLNDVDGDGEFDIFDVQALFAERGEAVVQSNQDLFDFNNDTTVDIFDVQALFNTLTQQVGSSTAAIEMTLSSDAPS